MNNPIYAATHAQFVPLVQPLGFRCIGNRYYYRIVGDVVQQFCVLCLHRQCTIRFGMSSVYEKNASFSPRVENTPSSFSF